MSGSESPRLFIALAIAACLSSPASAGTIHDPPYQDWQYLALADNYPSVGQFFGTDSAGSFAASGVLIDPSWVLTAGHVVDGATSLEFNFGGPEVYTADSWVAHPKWNGNVSKGFDIGLVKLTQSVPDSITPATRDQGTSIPLDQIGTSVGYGLTGTGLTGYDPSLGFQKRAGHNVIDDSYLGPGKPGRTPHIFLSDFDSGDPSDNYSGSATPVDLEYLIAPGDSGGGVFTDDGLLVGIHSFGASVDGLTDSDYGDISGHTWVPFFNEWIDSVIAGTGGGGNGGGKGNGKGGGKGGGRPFDLGSAAVPEPSTLALLCIGGLWLVGCCWRRRKR